VKELAKMSSKQVFQPIAYWTLSQQQLKTALPSLAFLKQKFKAVGQPTKSKQDWSPVGTVKIAHFLETLDPPPLT
jgi:predicted alpha/beta-fold hydrolase